MTLLSVVLCLAVRDMFIMGPLMEEALHNQHPSQQLAR